jgi:hypothetical protein
LLSLRGEIIFGDEVMKLWDKIKEHPVYSKVAAGLIVAVLIAISNELFSWNIFSSIFNFANKKYNIPMWGLLVIGISPIALMICIVVLIAFLQKNPQTQTNGESINVQPEPPWAKYVEDMIFFVLCQWRYNQHGSIDRNSLILLCPKCKRELDSLSYINYKGIIDSFRFQCFNSDFNTEIMYGDYSDFKGRVIKEIEGRIRTGEYKKKMQKNT